MSTTQHASTIDQGNRFNGAVYRDPGRVIVDSSTDTAALAERGFLTPAAVATLEAGARAWSANGLLELGAGDGAEFYFFGTDADNETINYMLTGLIPLYDHPVEKDQATARSGPQPRVPSPEPVAYIERLVATGVATLSSFVVNAAGGAHSLIEDGLGGDQWVDTITDTAAIAGVEIHNATNFPAFLKITPLQGIQALLMRTDLGTAATATVIARRLQGNAQNS